MKDMPAEPSPAEVAAIVEARSAFNEALVRKDLAAIDAVLHADYLVMPSFSTSCVDKPAILDTYKSYFADPDFITFARTPEGILLGKDRTRAAETGSWVGKWRGGSEGKGNRSGVYQAEWRLSEHGWKLMRENYVLLEG